MPGEPGSGRSPESLHDRIRGQAGWRGCERPRRQRTIALARPAYARSSAMTLGTTTNTHPSTAVAITVRTLEPARLAS